MSSFYEDASLVMIPSGYKTSKVYSAKPTDGAGDLSFTRSNDTATRVNSAGLIEKVRTNLALQSEAFNTTWAVNGIVVTANTAANPLTGATNADTITADAANNFHLINQSITYAAGEATVSVYVKANGYTWFVIDPSITNVFGYYNITTGVVGTKGSACTTSITNVGGGWYRCSVTFTATAGAAVLNFSIRNADNGGAFLGDGVSGFFIYGAQAEMGVATDYIATTSAAVSVGPVANVPRLDYLNSSCPRLILEGQRTNLATYSEQAVQYSKVRATIGSNVITSPDGYTNADSIIEDGTTGPHAFYNFGLTTFTAAAYTASVFAKKGSRDWFGLSLYDGTTDKLAFFNLATGVAGDVTAGATSTITNYGNGWYRCTVTATTTTTAGGIAVYAATANGSTSYAGTNGLTAGYFYGWQLELGAYATSYIPTLGSASTRGAEAASKTSASALIGQTQGTIVLDVENNESEINSFITLSPSATTVSNHVYLGQSAGNLALYVRSGGTYSIIAGSITSISGIKKVALAYGPSFARIYVNGAQVYNSTSAVIPSGMDKIEINSFNTSSDIGRVSIGEALIFKTILPNSDLAALTA